MGYVPQLTRQCVLCVHKVYFGASACKYHLAFHVLGVSCFTGMSYLVKKPELDQLNGLGWFGRYLAEDFFIAQMLRDRFIVSDNCLYGSQVPVGLLPYLDTL